MSGRHRPRPSRRSPAGGSASAEGAGTAAGISRRAAASSRIWPRSKRTPVARSSHRTVRHEATSGIALPNPFGSIRRCCMSGLRLRANTAAADSAAVDSAGIPLLRREWNRAAAEVDSAAGAAAGSRRRRAEADTPAAAPAAAEEAGAATAADRRQLSFSSLRPDPEFSGIRAFFFGAAFA